MSRQNPKSSVRRSAVKQMRRDQMERKTRQTRLFAIIGGVVVLSIVAVLVLIRANQPAAPVGEIVTVPAQEWPQPDGKALGPADAKVVLKEYADFQCPFCKMFNQSVQPQIIEDYVKTGKVRYEFHHFIIIDGNVGGSESRRSAEASECAAEQGRFWDYHEIVFANQGGEGAGGFSDQRLKAFAETIGLDTGEFNTCFNTRRTSNAVNLDDATARSIGLTGTPALLVNGKLVTNPMDYNAVKTAVDAALAEAE